MNRPSSPLPIVGFNSRHAIAAIAGLLLGSLNAASHADILYVGGGTNPGFGIERITSSGVGSLFAPTAFLPIGLAFDQVGNLYAAIDRTIVKFTIGGVGSVFASNLLASPRGLAFDRLGNLYVADAESNTIEKFTSSGIRSVFATDGLNGPRGLAFDRFDNLYVTNGGNNTIEKFASNGRGTVFASTGLSDPRGLAFDGSGNLFVANSTSSTIEKFTSNGVGTVFASGGLVRPFGVAFDSAGNLYAVNESVGTVVEFNGSGASRVFASTGLLGPEYLAFTDDAGHPLPLANQVPEPTSSVLVLGVLTALIARREPKIERLCLHLTEPSPQETPSGSPI